MSNNVTIESDKVNTVSFIKFIITFFQYFCCWEQKHENKNVSYEESQLSFKGKTNDMKLRLRTHIIFALKDDSTALI